jgi:hypothetical protein
MQVSGQLYAPAALTRGNRPRYPLDRRLGEEYFNRNEETKEGRKKEKEDKEKEMQEGRNVILKVTLNLEKMSCCVLHLWQTDVRHECLLRHLWTLAAYVPNETCP